MTYRVLWPIMRWPDGRDIEQASMGELGQAEFCDAFAEVTDEQWANCDAVVSAPDIPPEFRDKLERCRIFVTPKVGFDNIDLAAWGAMGVPVCNVPDYGTQEVADHAMALMLDAHERASPSTRAN